MIARKALPSDAPAMADLLNRIIAIGGTTAHETAKSPDHIRDHYIDGAGTITCVVAEDAGRVIGWQSIGWSHDEPHIGSFVDPEVQAKGTGAVMFALTRDLALQAGLTEIIASIRADNIPGLAYYARIGFVDIRHEPDFALSTGQITGRITRRYPLSA
ncbi:MAG: GNAT family N-acetyltransferase [Cypionkella sp.]|jgi:L-amino acid N-acyltransferase YncA